MASIARSNKQDARLSKRSLLSLLVAASVVSLPGASNAATPLLKEQLTVDIAAPVDKVWGLVSSFSDLTWVPVVKSSTADKGNRVGSVRTLDFGGAFLTEELIAYDAKGHTYTYKILDTAANRKTAPLSNVLATISVVSDGKGGSKATWQASFRRADSSATPATGLDDATAKRTMAGTQKVGLGGLKAKAEGV
jgi:mxaD protein